MLVIFDSLVSILPEGVKENESVDIRRILDGINGVLKRDEQGVPRKNPVAGLILHNTKKGEDDNGWPTFRGSTDIKNAISFMIVMRKNIFTKTDGDIEERIQFAWRKSRRGKMDGETYEYALIDHGEENDPQHWVEYVAYGRARKFEEYVTEKVLEVLEENGDMGMTIKELAESCEEFPDTERKQRVLIKKMEKQKQISRHKVGKSFVYRKWTVLDGVKPEGKEE